MTTVRKWIMGGPMVREEQRCQRMALPRDMPINISHVR